jgi:hypothetical protein
MDAADKGRSRGMSWIKVENATPNKPEVLKLARLLGVSRDDAFGKAMRFWIWLDGVTVDGVVDGVTSHDVDAVVGAVGVADALVSAGWLSVSKDGQSITVPNFDRHNGESAKARGLKAKRQAKWRAGNVDGEASTRASTPPSTREDKRREESSSSHDDEDDDGSRNGFTRDDLIRLLRRDPYRMTAAKDAVDEAIRAGCKPAELREVADYWRVSMKWSRKQLHFRVKTSFPGDDPTANWPPPDPQTANGRAAR